MDTDKQEPEAGAPIAKDYVDKDLVRLARKKIQFGLITCAGIVFLAGLYAWRLGPNRRYAGEPSKPVPVEVADAASGKAGTERHVEIQGQPLVGAAIRATTAKGTLGLRLVPVRGTNERLWLVLSGDGGEAPASGTYAGRLRAFGDLPEADSARELAASTPRPVFATVEAARAAQGGKLTTTSGEIVDVRDGDRIAYDIVDDKRARLVATPTDKLPDVDAWKRALAEIDLLPASVKKLPDGSIEFMIDASDAVNVAGARLTGAKLNAARVEPVRVHTETTWSALRASPPTGADVIGVYVTRPIPDDAYAIVVGEKPESYWYVTWLLVVIGAIAVMFAWSLVRAVRRDLLPVRV